MNGDKYNWPRRRVRAIAFALAALMTGPAVLSAAGCARENYRIPSDLSLGYRAAGIKLFDFVCPDGKYTTAQGCCFDGDNWVVAFNRFDVRGEECTLLCKFDAKGNFVQQSNSDLYMEHANNITFVPERNAYYVTSCQGTLAECWNGYTLVDRDTLKIIEKGRLEQPFFAMAYCPERQEYASARWTGSTLDFWDAGLNHIKGRDVTPSGTLSQGVFAANNAVWFVRSSQNGFHQEFLVYDWEGELIAAIPLDLENDVESEAVAIVNGEVYVTSNGGSRAGLFKVSFRRNGQ